MDIKTIILLSLIFQVITLLFFGFYVVFSKNKIKLIQYYTVSRTLITIAGIIYVVIPNLTPLWMSLAALLSFTALSIELFCFMHINKEIDRKLLFKFLSFAMAFALIYFVFSYDISIRVIVTSFYYSFIFGYTIYKISKPNIHSKIKFVFIFIGICFVFSNIIRGFYTFLTSSDILALSSSLVNQYWIFLFFLISAAFPICFLLIMNEVESLKLKQTNATKDKFFKIIAHDLREPLAQVISVTEVLERNFRDFSEEKMIQILTIMKSASERGFKLSENLLSWAQSQTNSIEFKPENIDLTTIIDENINLLQPKANEKNIKLFKMKFKPRMVRADRNMLNTVLRNLLSNAIKFTYPGGQVKIDTEIKNNSYQFSIHDNGKGMSSEIIKDLFKVDNVHIGLGTNKEKGTGIGLVLCKEFIEKHNGNIWVTSKEGTGSTFFFTIPMI